MPRGLPTIKAKLFVLTLSGQRLDLSAEFHPRFPHGRASPRFVLPLGHGP
ncbi:MAG: hypothetical protein N3C12_10850 [Candidatus Binatia bacterium]|nr:hypothetical protein [Candidatus Binatia bacterium]